MSPGAHHAVPSFANTVCGRGRNGTRGCPYDPLALLKRKMLFGVIQSDADQKLDVSFLPISVMTC